MNDFLAITANWDETDTRRCELIEKRIKHGRRTFEEEIEFDRLQRLYDLRRAWVRWLDTGNARFPLPPIPSWIAALAAAVNPQDEESDDPV